MRPNAKRGRRSRPSSHASEEQVELPLKRTRSTHSSPAAVPSTRSTPSFPARRQDHASRHSASATSRTSHSNDTTNHRDPSPIPELPLDEDPPPMPLLESKIATVVESVKRRGSRDSKRPITPIPLPKVAELNDEGHISDLSSLSELEDSEAETERLDDSPRKGPPKSVFAYNQGSNRPTPLKISQDLKPTKSPELEPIPDDEESPTGRKRKREISESSQTKEVPTETKSSRPATPSTAKAPISSEKSKKVKAIEEISEKSDVIPMDGIEPDSASPTTNGADDPVLEEPIEPEVPPSIEPEPSIEVEDVTKAAPPVDPEPDVDDAATENAESIRRDEEDAEAQTRKSAMDALTQIELEFAALRDKLFEERISDIDEEIRLVNEGKHPELMAMMEAVDKRRDDKIRLYNTQLKYAIQSQDNTMKATRAQLHSQYSQAVREIRERYLNRVSEGLYQIQRERRASDMVVQDYTYRISDCSNTRLRERQAYTMEVAILAGIAKYIGFPAAPEVKGAAPNEMQADLEAMGIVSRVSARNGASRAIDDYPEQQQQTRPYWGSKANPPSPPQTTHHHHHHHPHGHTHHHHASHPQEQPIPQRRAPAAGSSMQSSAHMSAAASPLPLSVLLQESGPIKLEQGQHAPNSLLPPQPMTMSQASRSPLHNYRPPPPPQAHIHQLQQHQHLHQSSSSYGPRANSMESGAESSSSLLGPERSRIMEEKEIGGSIPPLAIARYAVGKGYV